MSAMNSLKSAVRKISPAWLRRWRTRYVLAQQRREFAAMPVQEAFRRVYAEGHWGSGLSSGGGSDPACQAPYIQFVRDFIHEHAIETVVDLGCGDFRIGSQIAPGVRYYGLDIVPEVIERNRKLHGSASVSFQAANILEDELPAGDLCLVRQVFQHLSNAEIRIALERLRQYRFALISEHIPTVDFIPNIDTPHGPHTRLYENSGVVLDKAPFLWPCRVVLETAMDDGLLLRTYLISTDE